VDEFDATNFVYDYKVRLDNLPNPWLLLNCFKWDAQMHKIVVVAFLFMARIQCEAQPDWGIQLGLGGMSVSWFAIHVEVTVLKFDSTSTHQSLRFASGYGLRITNASYLPLELHYLAFHGSDHLEAIAGVNVQTEWYSAEQSIGKEFPRSPINPIAAFGYRYEKPTGGFVFRIAAGSMLLAADPQFLHFLAVGLGASF